MESEYLKETTCLKLSWVQQQECTVEEVKCVEVVIGPSAGANNDMFEIYFSGAGIVENSPLLTCRLERKENLGTLSFEKELQLFKRTYQFVFRIEDVHGNVKMVVSDDHKQTQLISGRLVNYVELAYNNENCSNNHSKGDVFEDVNETLPLVSRRKEKSNKEKENRSGCGCTPKGCLIL